MDNPKLTLKKASTAFGYAILEALEKGKGSTSSIDSDTAKELQNNAIATTQFDAILKAALKEDDSKKEKLAEKRARKNQAKAKKPKLTESQILRNQVSILTKSNTELKKQISSISSSDSIQNRDSLAYRALEEIKKLNARNSILEKENKALRALVLKNISKSLPSSGEMVFYGGQYSNPET